MCIYFMYIYLILKQKWNYEKKDIEGEEIKLEKVVEYMRYEGKRENVWGRGRGLGGQGGLGKMVVEEDRLE